MEDFDAQTPYAAFDECRMRLSQPPVPAQGSAAWNEFVRKRGIWTLTGRFFRYMTHAAAGDDIDYNFQRPSMTQQWDDGTGSLVDRTSVLDGLDPDVIEINRDETWDAEPMKGTKRYKDFRCCPPAGSGLALTTTLKVTAREERCTCAPCRTDPVEAIKENSQDPCKYIHILPPFEYVVMYKEKHGGAAATRGKAERDELLRQKKEVLDKRAEKLKNKFDEWQDLDEELGKQPVLAFGMGENEFGLAVMMSKPRTARNTIWNGGGVGKGWAIKATESYFDILWIECIDDDAGIYEVGNKDRAIVESIIDLDGDLFLDQEEDGDGREVLRLSDDDRARIEDVGMREYTCDVRGNLVPRK